MAECEDIAEDWLCAKTGAAKARARAVALATVGRRLSMAENLLRVDWAPRRRWVCRVPYYVAAGWNVTAAALSARVSAREIPCHPIACDAGKSLNAAAKAMGEPGFGAHWTGQGAPLARSMPAGQLVAALVDELKSG